MIEMIFEFIWILVLAGVYGVLGLVFMTVPFLTVMMLVLTILGCRGDRGYSN